MKVAPGGFGRCVPIECGATNLQSSDPIKRSNKGAVGARINEAQGATWEEAPRALNVNHPGGSFREFRLSHQTDLNLRFSERFDAERRPAAEDPEDSGQKAFNYGAEPLWERLERSNPPRFRGRPRGPT